MNEQRKLTTMNRRLTKQSIHFFRFLFVIEIF